jgi:hypothetical protein
MRDKRSALAAAGLRAALTAAWLLAGRTASADELSDQVGKAEDLAVQGKIVPALDAMRDASVLLWEKGPLAFRHALWVVAEPGGWAMYEARSGDSFAAGEDMIAYAEPVGFGWSKAGELWLIDWTADVVVRSKDGTELKRVNDFQHITVKSHERNQEVFASFTYTLSGVPPGAYVVDTILRDKVSGKSGTFSLPFVIR